MLLVALVALLAVAAFGVGRASASDTRAPAGSVRHVTVEPGQTLWDIARASAPKRDVRESVAQLLQLNELSEPRIRPGQQLAVPASG